MKEIIHFPPNMPTVQSTTQDEQTTKGAHFEGDTEGGGGSSVKIS